MIKHRREEKERRGGKRRNRRRKIGKRRGEEAVRSVVRSFVRANWQLHLFPATEKRGEKPPHCKRRETEWMACDIFARFWVFYRKECQELHSFYCRRNKRGSGSSVERRQKWKWFMPLFNVFRKHFLALPPPPFSSFPPFSSIFFRVVSSSSSFPFFRLVFSSFPFPFSLSRKCRWWCFSSSFLPKEEEEEGGKLHITFLFSFFFFISHFQPPFPSSSCLLLPQFPPSSFFPLLLLEIFCWGGDCR